MKKNRFYLIIIVALVVVSIVVILFRTGTFRANDAPRSDLFAVRDTASITKVLIAATNGEYVLLTRRAGEWYVQDSIRTMPEKVNQLLSVIRNVSLRQTVAKTAQSNINKMMSVNAVKVEIYRTAPRFKLFGIKFFDRERKVKTYYMGPATMDNMANFAILKGFDEPCIVSIPGFRGFLTPTFSSRAVDWYNCDLFATKVTRIKSLYVQDFEHPDESFTVERAGTRFFNLFDAQHRQIMSYDTVRLLDMLAEYRDKNYERIVTGLSPAERDSIIRFNRFKIITLTDINGQKTILEMYRKLTPDTMYLDAILGGESEIENMNYNRDKFYAVLNGRYQNLLQCQYYHFDRQNQPLSYFLNP